MLELYDNDSHVIQGWYILFHTPTIQMHIRWRIYKFTGQCEAWHGSEACIICHTTRGISMGRVFWRHALSTFLWVRHNMDRDKPGVFLSDVPTRLSYCNCVMSRIFWCRYIARSNNGRGLPSLVLWVQCGPHACVHKHGPGPSPNQCSRKTHVKVPLYLLTPSQTIVKLIQRIQFTTWKQTSELHP